VDQIIYRTSPLSDSPFIVDRKPIPRPSTHEILEAREVLGVGDVFHPGDAVLDPGAEGCGEHGDAGEAVELEEHMVDAGGLGTTGGRGRSLGFLVGVCFWVIAV
jgi:hypothetical protein